MIRRTNKPGRRQGTAAPVQPSTKVALVGDVHANLPALQAVLADAKQRDVTAIWNIGDFVGYGAFPEEVVQTLRREGAVSIVGNYDLKVLKVPRKMEEWAARKDPQKLLAFRWAHDHLSEQSREYLAGLPLEIRMNIEGRRVLLTHGSPESNEEHLTPDTPSRRLGELAKIARADIVVCGHSHEPFARKVGGVWFINTGSVGRSDDGNPKACYAVLNVSPRFVRVKHYRLEYDIDAAVDAICRDGLPEEFAQMILTGRSLDDVKKQP